jgi:uncharacterized protein with FMN-binding domain
MKRTPVLVLGGTIAGFIGVLSFHTRPVTALPVPGAATGGTTSASAPASASARPAGPTTGTGAVRSAVGANEQFGYGVLDVKVTVQRSRITDVTVPNLQTAEPTSQQISDQAIPMLRSEVLTAQSAHIDGVSGATFTSAAYAQSLQAALDQLHIK